VAGFTKADLYGPNFGFSTNAETAPEAEEQEAVGFNSATPSKVTATKSGNVWMALVVLFVLLWVFNFI